MALDLITDPVVSEPEVNFELMLDCTRNVINEWPLLRMQSLDDEVDTSISSGNIISAIMRVKTLESPRGIRKNYQRRVLYKYFKILKKSGVRFNKGRDGYGEQYAKAFCRAFKIITGHTFNSAYRLRIGKLIALLPEEDVPLLRMHTYAVKAKVRTPMRADIQADVLAQLRSENETLAWLVTIYSYTPVTTDSFKILKEQWMRKGLTKAGWKFLCKQSKCWVLKAANLGFRGVISAANNKIPYSLLKNKQMRVALDSFMINNKLTALFMRDFRKSGLPMCRWNPLPVGNVGNVYETQEWMIRRELDTIRDYLRNNAFPPVTTIRGLFRRAEEWHIEQRRNRGDRKHYEFPEWDGVRKQTVVDGFEFTWISDSTKLWEEGDTLHHCVGSYGRDCKEQSYAVWSVANHETGERATLGCRIRTVNYNGNSSPESVSYSQCYSYCNGRVSEELKSAVHEFIAYQNEDLKYVNESDPHLSKQPECVV